MPRGLPRSYIKKAAKQGGSWSQIFKRAWRLYKGSKVHKAVKAAKGSRKSTRKKTKRRVGRKMSKKKRRRSGGLTIPLAPIMGLAAGFAGPMGDSPIEYAMQKDWRSFFVRLAKSYTGFDVNTGGWSAQYLANGVLPLLAGVLVHKFVGGPPLNFNKMLARNKIPFIRI